MGITVARFHVEGIYSSYRLLNIRDFYVSVKIITCLLKSSFPHCSENVIKHSCFFIVCYIICFVCFRALFGGHVIFVRLSIWPRCCLYNWQVGLESTAVQRHGEMISPYFVHVCTRSEVLCYVGLV